MKEVKIECLLVCEGSRDYMVANGVHIISPIFVVVWPPTCASTFSSVHEHKA